jgi:hypothetical protein
MSFGTEKMALDDSESRPSEPESRFLMTPAQHRRRAQDMREAGRPDLAKHHELLAQAIERAQAQQNSQTG